MMLKKRILFFDLENTLIEHWTDQRLCWTENNKKFLKECDPSTIGIFSFALWCDENIAILKNDGMLDMIEQEYGINISHDEIIHTNEMIEAAKVESGHNTQYPNSNNKEAYFLNWVCHNKARLSGYDEIWLVDDTVDPRVFTHNGLRIIFKNPVEIQSFV